MFFIIVAVFNDGKVTRTDILDIKSASFAKLHTDLVPNVIVLKYCSLVSIANAVCFLYTVLKKDISGF